MEGFNYSTALKSKPGPWTFDALNEWLHKPSAYAPGTRMTFAGISNDQERANVIDYLHTLSPKPEPLPASGAPTPSAPTASAPTASAPTPSATPAPEKPPAPATPPSQPPPK
jgi:cytochrome c